MRVSKRRQRHSLKGSREEIRNPGQHSSPSLMVLSVNPAAPSARPSSNDRWIGNDDGLGALFDGRKGAVASANAFSHWWTVFSTRVVDCIVWKRRLMRHRWSASEAGTIRIHPLEGDRWICIVREGLAGLRRRTEASEGCYCKSDAACNMQVRSPSWTVWGRKMVVWVDQDTK